MTYISYICNGADGHQLRTKSYPEVKQFLAEHGGTYKQNLDFVPSKDVEYCRPGAITISRAEK